MKNIVIIIGIFILLYACKNDKQEVVKDNSTELTSNDVSNFVELKSVELASGALQRLDSLSSKFVTPRPVDVWLPETYSKDKKYAVLYMHDGQMLFDAKTTWNKQEWKVDEWASQLMRDNKTKDFIVVAVHNIANIRWFDLFPQKAFQYMSKTEQENLIAENGGAQINFNGDNYLKFIIEELKPEIDTHFSVHTDKENTFVMGSSMGGLMSMYAISEYPEVFGGAACISTHWIGAMPNENNPFPNAIFKYMAANFPKAGSHDVYFDYGNKTLDQHYPQYAPRVDEVLKSKGYTSLDSKNLFFEGTDHSENSWNQRLDQPLVFLLGQ